MKDHKGTLLIQNLKIANVTNQRAMDIAITSMDRPTPAPGEPLTFAKVIIRNCETASVGRDETGRLAALHWITSASPAGAMSSRLPRRCCWRM